MHYISILSTLVTFAFAIAVFGRYRRRKGTHLLMWGIGLVFYGLGTLSEAISIFTFNEIWMKLWYLCGAMLTAAWLGQGTVYLLVRKRGVANTLTGVLVVVSLLSAYLVFSAPVNSVAAAARRNYLALAWSGAHVGWITAASHCCHLLTVQKKAPRARQSPANRILPERPGRLAWATASRAASSQ